MYVKLISQETNSDNKENTLEDVKDILDVVDTLFKNKKFEIKLDTNGVQDKINSLRNQLERLNNDIEKVQEKGLENAKKQLEYARETSQIKPVSSFSSSSQRIESSSLKLIERQPARESEIGIGKVPSEVRNYNYEPVDTSEKPEDASEKKSSSSESGITSFIKNLSNTMDLKRKIDKALGKDSPKGIFEKLLSGAKSAVDVSEDFENGDSSPMQKLSHILDLYNNVKDIFGSGSGMKNIFSKIPSVGRNAFTGIKTGLKGIKNIFGSAGTAVKRTGSAVRGAEVGETAAEVGETAAEAAAETGGTALAEGAAEAGGTALAEGAAEAGGTALAEGAGGAAAELGAGTAGGPVGLAIAAGVIAVQAVGEVVNYKKKMDQFSKDTKATFDGLNKSSDEYDLNGIESNLNKVKGYQKDLDDAQSRLKPDYPIAGGLNQVLSLLGIGDYMYKIDTLRKHGFKVGNDGKIDVSKYKKDEKSLNDLEVTDRELAENPAAGDSDEGQAIENYYKLLLNPNKGREESKQQDQYAEQLKKFYPDLNLKKDKQGYTTIANTDVLKNHGEELIEDNNLNNDFQVSLANKNDYSRYMQELKNNNGKLNYNLVQEINGNHSELIPYSSDGNELYKQLEKLENSSEQSAKEEYGQRIQNSMVEEAEEAPSLSKEITQYNDLTSQLEKTKSSKKKDALQQQINNVIGDLQYNIEDLPVKSDSNGNLIIQNTNFLKNLQKSLNEKGKSSSILKSISINGTKEGSTFEVNGNQMTYAEAQKRILELNEKINAIKKRNTTSIKPNPLWLAVSPYAKLGGSLSFAPSTKASPELVKAQKEKGQIENGMNGIDTVFDKINKLFALLTNGSNQVGGSLTDSFNQLEGGTSGLNNSLSDLNKTLEESTYEADKFSDKLKDLELQNSEIDRKLSKSSESNEIHADELQDRMYIISQEIKVTQQQTQAYEQMRDKFSKYAGMNSYTVSESGNENDTNITKGKSGVANATNSLGLGSSGDTTPNPLENYENFSELVKEGEEKIIDLQNQYDDLARQWIEAMEKQYDTQIDNYDKGASRYETAAEVMKNNYPEVTKYRQDTVEDALDKHEAQGKEIAWLETQINSNRFDDKTTEELKEKLRDLKNEELQYVETLQKYKADLIDAKFDEATHNFTENIDKLKASIELMNKIGTENNGSQLLDSTKDLIEQQEKYREGIIATIAPIKQQMDALKAQGKDNGSEYVYLKDEYDKYVQKFQEANSSIQDSYDNLVSAEISEQTAAWDKVQKSFDRNITDMENKLDKEQNKLSWLEQQQDAVTNKSDLEKQLTALQADTSGENASKIREVQKQIRDADKTQTENEVNHRISTEKEGLEDLKNTRDQEIADAKDQLQELGTEAEKELNNLLVDSDNKAGEVIGKLGDMLQTHLLDKIQQANELLKNTVDLVNGNPARNPFDPYAYEGNNTLLKNLQIIPEANISKNTLGAKIQYMPELSTISTPSSIVSKVDNSKKVGDIKVTMQIDNRGNKLQTPETLADFFVKGVKKKGYKF